MLEVRTLLRSMLTVKNLPAMSPHIAGMKYFPPPQKYDNIEYPERMKLKGTLKVPLMLTNIKPPKMQKRLRYMRGPETVHNQLIHKQYGIIATGGGRLKHEHFEMIRFLINRNLVINRMFAIWRVDPPWQPVTKKGQGQRMGGGKGAIDHYATPIKAGRVILEISGHCEFAEVKKMLERVAKRLPFSAEVVSQEILDNKNELEERLNKLNLNSWNFEYIIKNNMGGCSNWLSPFDRRWFGKYQ